MARSRRGANAVEFALVLPVLLTFAFGVIDVSWAYMLRHGASSAAAAGARAGARTSQTGDPNGAAAAAALAKWNTLDLPATPTIVAFRQGTPQTVVVRVSVPLHELVGLVVGPEKIDVTVAQRMEDQP
jgi:Flp pilus assembly protein TadG